MEGDNQKLNTIFFLNNQLIHRIIRILAFCITEIAEKHNLIEIIQDKIYTKQKHTEGKQSTSLSYRDRDIVGSLPAPIIKMKNTDNTAPMTF